MTYKRVMNSTAEARRHGRVGSSIGLSIRRPGFVFRYILLFCSLNIITLSLFIVLVYFQFSVAETKTLLA